MTKEEEKEEELEQLRYEANDIVASLSGIIDALNKIQADNKTSNKSINTFIEQSLPFIEQITWIGEADYSKLERITELGENKAGPLLSVINKLRNAPLARIDEKNVTVKDEFKRNLKLAKDIGIQIGQLETTFYNFIKTYYPKATDVVMHLSVSEMKKKYDEIIELEKDKPSTARPRSGSRL